VTDRIVVPLTCDNTPLDNDMVQDDLRRHLTRVFGAASCGRFWARLEQRWDESMLLILPEANCLPRLIMEAQS